MEVRRRSGFFFFGSHVSQGRLLLVLGRVSRPNVKNHPFFYEGNLSDVQVQICFLGGEIRKKNLLQGTGKSNISPPNTKKSAVKIHSQKCRVGEMGQF